MKINDLLTENSKKPGLWANIHAKRKRIKGGSGERMRTPGSKGAPSDADLKSSRTDENDTDNKRLGPDRNDPWEQGWRAAHRRQDETECPYERGSTEYARWMDGYEEGRAQPEHYNESANPAQQAAIAVNMKKQGKKPKHQDVAEATGDGQFDAMMKTVARAPTAKERNAERIRQKRERQEDSRKRASDVFGTSPADKLSIRKTDVAEGNDRSDIRPPRVGDEIILKNPNYRGVIVKLGTDGEFSFKNESDGKRYRGNTVMIDRNLSQENRYKERSDTDNKRFDDAMSSDMERINKSGALKKFGIGEEIDEGKTGPGLWANIHAKQNRIKSGSGERMRKPGSKGAPKASDFKKAAAKNESSNYGDLDEAFNLEEEINKLDEKSAAWQRKEGKSKSGGLNKKGVASYRRANPGSKLQTAVTTKPSKLKPGSKPAKRRKSFCARMSGMKGPMKDEKGKPTRKALALRKWNC